MKWIKASDRLPEIWVYSGVFSKTLNLKIHGKHPKVGRFVIQDKPFFEVNDESVSTIFYENEFHLVEWLDETKDTSREELFEEAKLLMIKLLPPEQFGENFDAEALYNILEELSK